MFIRRLGSAARRFLLGPMGRGSTLNIASISGIPVGLHYSWFLLLVLVTWSLATQFFPSLYWGWSGPQYWATALVAALLLFASVLAHEFAHSIVARRRGIEVQGITLFLLGGISQLKAEPRTAWEELSIASVGPATSLVLAGLFWLALQPLSNTYSPLQGILVYLSVVNLVLGLFNLIPAYPMDGGRIFRSIVWAVSGNFRLAATIAGWGGQLFGLAFAAWGLFRVLQGNPGGLLLVLVGLFLFAAAAASSRRPEAAEAEDAPLVSSAMWAEPLVVPPDMPLHDAVHRRLLPSGRRALFVCEGDRLVGVLNGADAAFVPTTLWRAVPVRNAMRPLPVPYVRPDDDLWVAVELLATLPDGELPVVNGDRLVGSLSTSDALRLMRDAGSATGAR